MSRRLSTLDYIKTLIDQAKRDKERLRKLWEFLKRFKWEFLMYACDMKKRLNGVNFIHVVDTCELVAFLFPREDPCSDISCFVMDELHSMGERFLLVPSVVEELIAVLARDLGSFAQNVKEIQELFSKSYKLFFDLRFLENIWRKLGSIMRARSLSYKHDPRGPVRRIIDFIQNYSPMKLDDLPIRVPKNVDSPADDVRRRIESSVGFRRIGPSWETVIKNDARTANVTLFLNKKAMEIRYERLFFPIYTRSMAFNKIQWRDEQLRTVFLPLGRPYLPLCMRITSQIMIDENPESGPQVMEGLADEIIELYRPYRGQRLPPATVGLVLKPLSVIVDCTKGILEEKMQVSKVPEGEGIVWMHPDLREWTEKQIERCKRFLDAVDDIHEIEMKAVEGFERIYKELIEFLPEHRRRALREALERILRG